MTDKIKIDNPHSEQFSTQRMNGGEKNKNKNRQGDRLG